MSLCNVSFNFIHTLIFFFDSITAPTVEQTNLTSPFFLVNSQVFSNGGSIKGRDHTCSHLSTLFPRANRAIKCGGVDHVIVVGRELVSVFHHHVLHHLLYCVTVREASRINFKTSFALENLGSVGFLNVSYRLRLDYLFTTIITSLCWTTGHSIGSVEFLVVLFHMLEPFQSLRMSKSCITAPASQLKFSDNLALVLDAMNLLKMLLNAAHVLHQIIGDPESFSAKKIRRQAEFAIDSVKVGRDVNVAGNGL